MFDAITSLYNKYAGTSAAKLVVGVDIRDQSLPFMFEVMDQATSLPADQYILPINPETYRISHTPRATATQTLGGVFEDNIGMGLSRIALQGTFGYLGTLPGGHGKSLHGMSQDGWELFKEIEGIILRFYERFGTYSANGTPTRNPVGQSAPPELRFYNYTDEDYYVVQINRFDITRSIQRKFLYQYDIQMTALRRLDEPSKTEDDLVETLNYLWPPDEKTTSLWASLLDGYSAVYGYLSDVTNAVDSLQADLATISQAVTGFRQGLSDFIAAPFGLVDASLRTVENIIDTVVSVEEIPHEFIDHMRDTKRTLLTLRRRPDLFLVPRTATAPGTRTTTKTEVITAPLPAGATESLPVMVIDIPETSLFDASLESAADMPATSSTIQDNDTIYTIAHRMLGDAAEWKRIAILNQLEYPFIVSDRRDALSPIISTEASSSETASNRLYTNLAVAVGNVLMLSAGSRYHIATITEIQGKVAVFNPPTDAPFPAGTTVTVHAQIRPLLSPGEQILLPGRTTAGMAIAGTGSDFETTLYGTDEYLDDLGQMGPDQNGGPETVSGLANLAMQLRHRLMTIRGELASLGHPTYGSYLPLIIGRITSPFWLERAKLEAKLTIMEDPRIARVGKIAFNVDGTAISIQTDVYPINSSIGTRMNIIVN